MFPSHKSAHAVAITTPRRESIIAKIYRRLVPMLIQISILNVYLGTSVATFNVDNGATVFRIINVQVVSGRYAHRIVSRFQPELQNYRFH
jgi:hypothetical protein